MLIQEEMIARVRQLCTSEPAVIAAWMYGSFAKGEGDAHSDIEFGAYLDDAVYDAFEPVRWVSQIEPLALYFVNEFGTGTAIFENLVRGKFHFERAGDMVKVRELRKLNRYRTCTASLRGRELEQGYQAAWAWGKELARALVSEHGFDTREVLVQRLDARFAAAFKGEQAP